MVLPVPERPKNKAVSPSGPIFAEQCMGRTARGGKIQFITVKIDFLISPAYSVPAMTIIFSAKDKATAVVERTPSIAKLFATAQNLASEISVKLGEAATGGGVRSVLASAGVHGDETAPIELLSKLVRDIAEGQVTLTCRLLVILGNVDAMRAACRYLDDDLNRLFSGRHAQVPHSHEAPRAAVLERAATQFFAGTSYAPGARWHIDMHTAIRASVFEQFALLPHTGAPLSRATCT